MNIAKTISWKVGKANWDQANRQTGAEWEAAQHVVFKDAVYSNTKEAAKSVTHAKCTTCASMQEFCTAHRI